VHREGALRAAHMDARSRPDRGDPSLADALGGTPSHWACYRFSVKLRKERDQIAGCIDALAASLREHYPDMGREVAIDASDMPVLRERAAVYLQRRPRAPDLQRPRRILGASLRRQHKEGRRFLWIPHPRRRLHQDRPAACMAGRDGPQPRVQLCRAPSRRGSCSWLHAPLMRDGHGLRQHACLCRVR
jgi:hypothetical protein